MTSHNTRWWDHFDCSRHWNNGGKELGKLVLKSQTKLASQIDKVCKIERRKIWEYYRIHKHVNQSWTIHDDNTRISRSLNSKIGILQMAINSGEHRFIAFEIKNFSAIRRGLNPQRLVGLEKSKQLFHGICCNIPHQGLVHVRNARWLKGHSGNRGRTPREKIKIERRAGESMGTKASHRQVQRRDVNRLNWWELGNWPPYVLGSNAWYSVKLKWNLTKTKHIILTIGKRKKLYIYRYIHTYIWV